MSAGDGTMLGLLSQDEDGMLESILLGDYDDEQRNRKKRRKLIAALAAAGYITSCHDDAMPARRAAAFFRERLDWEKHLETSLGEGHGCFQKFYRMSHSFFLKLVNLLRPHLEGDKKMANLRTGGYGIITTEMMLHCVLRFLSGTPCRDIRDKIGMSEPSFYRVLCWCIDAILNLDELEYHFPQTPDEISEASNEFSRISSHQVIQGCVACLDGMLLRMPTCDSVM